MEASTWHEEPGIGGFGDPDSPAGRRDEPSAGTDPADTLYWSPSVVLGYRVWRVHARALIGARMAWRSPDLTAVCLTTGERSRIPHRRGECGEPACGIYARRALSGVRGLRAAADAPGTVAGLVALSGTVIEHDRGYRAERATVLAAGSLWGDRLVVGWSIRWLRALFATPVATLSGSGPMPGLLRPLPNGGRGASLSLLADRLEAIGTDPAAFGLIDPADTIDPTET